MAKKKPSKAAVAELKKSQKQQKPKFDPIAAAKAVTELSEWIEDAEKELNKYSKKRFTIRINESYSEYSDLKTYRLGDATNKRLDKYLKRIFRERIAECINERTALLRKIARNTK